MSPDEMKHKLAEAAELIRKAEAFSRAGDQRAVDDLLDEAQVLVADVEEANNRLIDAIVAAPPFS